jgi:low affinity Fe/Cu permease
MARTAAITQEPAGRRPGRHGRRPGVAASLANAAEGFARAITTFAGSTTAFLLALGIIVVWALVGPLFGFSDTWQLVVNTGTTIVTFLMVFLIQRTQNKDSLAIQLKLNELVAALQGASNRLVNVEDLSEAELQSLHRHFEQLASLAKRDVDVLMSHSVEEAESRHAAKLEDRPSKSRPKVAAGKA